MPRKPAHSRRLSATILGTALAFAASGAVHAQADQAGMVYIFSVTAPALRGACEDAMPGYAQDFDAAFGAWSETNKAEIAASKQAYLDANPGQSPAELQESIASSATQDFEEAILERKQQVCSGLMSYMAMSAIG
jgi:hypothetical protein